ncbi:ATP-dependent nuclease, subunit A [Paenibacillus pasadenensis]|uniref:ATP-dependent helicase/nuclease subunit A n=1 Tax=Paenibacillus pasadenensis TaxID=217090 RepID=A0A2N5N8B8_9BACL|nr:helicase-exonuclease AddAB subunit AddA [Paenibacillus pasadenensis]PLT46549.1 ATP-dependent nuclease, subunit A [Paenibacillus pasadenensis]
MSAADDRAAERAGDDTIVGSTGDPTGETVVGRKVGPEVGPKVGPKVGPAGEPMDETIVGPAGRASDEARPEALDAPPPKPAGSRWTDDQWAAVTARGGDVLVAAAAGSGKTAVLVERIITMISEDTDVDQLLVATFTKAAAAEMKERIRAALEAALELEPESEHLRRQLALLGRASITTLHSFCLDVIRRYYPMIGLDPGFRVANETEGELLRLEVLDELFEERYAASDNDGGLFLELADRYGRKERELCIGSSRLYEFSRSQPWPDDWLRGMAAAFRVEEPSDLEATPWLAALSADLRLSLEGAEAALSEALELAGAPGGPMAYADTLREDLSLVSSIRESVLTRPWDEWRDAWQLAGSFGRLKAARASQDADPLLQERAKELRAEAKGIVEELGKELFSRPAADYVRELRELAPLLETLAELVIEFDRRYRDAKRRKGLLDFGDLEHYCLAILRGEGSSPERAVPSAAALDYRRQFREVLLDEYQDTNRVQESIVELLTGSPADPPEERGGRRFMVGDVKQSIYRFRLAEPDLFLAKYRRFGRGDAEAGRRIDLARNFRSRSEVVDGVNAVFRALMRESVAEMDYDRSAELVLGASYPEPEPRDAFAVELALIDRERGAAAAEAPAAAEGSDGAEAGQREEAADLQTAQLEARYIARRLLDLHARSYAVHDGRGGSRPMAWRDVVILLRATKSWAPVLMEELQAAGIPAYAELGSGYFDAVEVDVMLSALRVTDNPFQDIPLAGILRSPMFGLTAEELALIRIVGGSGPYYEAAVRTADHLLAPQELRAKLSAFLGKLDEWRDAARQGSLADLIWRIYSETGYYDWAGGLPAGAQRQANLRALHERARQFEAGTARGLFRFLRFMDRMRENGGDLGTAGALGEGEDVVRIMSIHKSKGLEFPIVFVAGLGKKFNQQDVSSPFLLHKELGFGPKFVDPELRLSYPTLPCLAIRRRMRMEMQAEELRVLYVALTRPKEKLVLVGTVDDAVRQTERWNASLGESGVLSDYRIAAARRFLDWLGPLAGFASSEHSDERSDGQAPPAPAAPVELTGARAEPIPASGAVPSPASRPEASFASWKKGILPYYVLGGQAAAGAEPAAAPDRTKERQAALHAVPLAPGGWEREVERRLSWSYPHAEASRVAAKTSVTELKRLRGDAARGEDAVPMDSGPFVEPVGRMAAGRAPAGAASAAGAGAAPLRSAPTGEEAALRLRRPKFMEQRGMTAADKGTAVHTLLQHVPLDGPLPDGAVEAALARLVRKRILTEEQAGAADVEAAKAFFAGPLGRRLLAAERVWRELPFSCLLPAREAFPDAGLEAAGEPVLLQGVIDCLFEEAGRLVLCDFKSDRVPSGDYERAADKHRFQLELYRKAVEQALGRPVAEVHVYFLRGRQAVRMVLD